MKIVFVLHTNAVGDQRVNKMARSLKGAGHDVLVVGALYGGVAQQEVENGISIHRIKLRSSRFSKKNKFVGAWKFIEYAFKVRKQYRKADVWHCNDIEGLMIGMLAKFFRPRLKIVYDAHELESERNNIKKWVRRFFYMYEKIFVRFAHTVITVSPSIEKFYLDNFKVRRNVIIYNCPFLTDFKRTDVLRQELGIEDDKILFLYSGMLMKGRGVQALLDVFHQLDSNRYHIVFMAKGALQDLVIDYSKRYSNIHFKPAVPYDRILEYASGADYGIQSVEPVCLSYIYSMPNKLFEYIHAGLPIICNNLKDSRQLVESNRVGYGLDELDVENFRKIIPKLSRGDKSKMMDRLELLRKAYCWENEEIKLIALYKSVEETLRPVKKK